MFAREYSAELNRIASLSKWNQHLLIRCIIDSFIIELLIWFVRCQYWCCYDSTKWTKNQAIAMFHWPSIWNLFQMRLITAGMHWTVVLSCECVMKRVQYTIILCTCHGIDFIHMLQLQFVGLPSSHKHPFWYLMRILITQSSKHINWNNISVYFMHRFNTFFVFDCVPTDSFAYTPNQPK